MGTITHTLEDYIAQAMPALTEIPGFTALAKADGQDYDALAAEYPDAVFALMIANNLFHHDREISEITQQAFFSIMDGMDICRPSGFRSMICRMFIVPFPMSQSI